MTPFFVDGATKLFRGEDLAMACFSPRMGWALVVLFACGGAGCQVVSQGQNSDGVRLFQQGYYQAAAQRFQQAIQSNPKDADGYYNLAALYHQMGKQFNRPEELAQAESYYKQALYQAPEHGPSYRGLAVLMTELNRSDEAFKLLEDWAARNPQRAAPHIELARLYEETGNRQAAKEQLLAAISVEATNSDALASLGRVREQLGETTEALAAYERSLAANRFQPEINARVAALRSAFSAAPLTAPANTGPAPGQSGGVQLR